jgi:hypothetical protein
VLIEPTLVLTSAHCLPPNVDYALADIEVFFGVVFSQGGDRISVSNALAHPGWSRDAFANDIGIIELAVASPVEPARLDANAAEVVAVGDAVRAVGFGVSQAGGGIDGIKRSGQMTLSALDESSLFVDSEATLTCSGDSGGPLFADGPLGKVLIGIHSRSNCETAGLAERVDSHIDSFISDFIAGIPPIEAICSNPDSCNNDLIGGCHTAPGGNSPMAVLLVLLGLIAPHRTKRQALHRKRLLLCRQLLWQRW